jgi:phage gp36-like protein
MAYIKSDDLRAYIQDALITQGLDDNSEGLRDEETFASIYKAVELEVHGYVEGRYQVPFTTDIPAAIVSGCLILCAEAIWTRRGFSSENNPFTKQAASVREHLKAIRDNKIQISTKLTIAPYSGAVISEPSFLNQADRRLIL